MSHDTHHTPQDSQKVGTSFKSSIWFMLILAFLFISAVNFVQVMSHDDGGHGEEHGTEHAAPAAHGEEHGHEAEAHGHEGAEHNAH